jgi:hypothetical protein
MMNRLSFGIVSLALSMACSSSPTSPTPPVAAAPAPPIASTPQMVSVTIRALSDVLYYPETTMLFADAHWDDGSSAPITPTWESSSGVVTLLANGPVAHAISKEAGSAVITARVAGLSATQTITINPGYRPRP